MGSKLVHGRMACTSSRRSASPGGVVHTGMQFLQTTAISTSTTPPCSSHSGRAGTAPFAHPGAADRARHETLNCLPSCGGHRPLHAILLCSFGSSGFAGHLRSVATRMTDDVCTCIVNICGRLRLYGRVRRDFDHSLLMQWPCGGWHCFRSRFPSECRCRPC